MRNCLGSNERRSGARVLQEAQICIVQTDNEIVSVEKLEELASRKRPEVTASSIAHDATLLDTWYTAQTDLQIIISNTPLGFRARPMFAERVQFMNHSLWGIRREVIKRRTDAYKTSSKH